MGEWYYGEIRLFPYNQTPDGWLDCDGSILPVAMYQALFSLIGNSYGGDGKTTFGLPDLRGRVPVGFSAQDFPDRVTGIPYCGAQGGTETVSLSETQMPLHTHMFGVNPSNVSAALAVANSVPSTSTKPTSAPASAPAAPNLYAPPGQLQPMNPASIAPTGAGAPHENRQPYLALRYCIAISGVYPPHS